MCGGSPRLSRVREESGLAARDAAQRLRAILVERGGDGEDAAKTPFPERHVARDHRHGGDGGQDLAFADDGRRGNTEKRIRHPFHPRERRPAVLGDLLVVAVEEDAVPVEEEDRPRVELLRLVRRPVVESLRVNRVEEPLRAGLVRHARDLPPKRVLVAPLIGAKDSRKRAQAFANALLGDLVRAPRGDRDRPAEREEDEEGGRDENFVASPGPACVGPCGPTRREGGGFSGNVTRVASPEIEWSVPVRIVVRRRIFLPVLVRVRRLAPARAVERDREGGPAFPPRRRPCPDSRRPSRPTPVRRRVPEGRPRARPFRPVRSAPRSFRRSRRDRPPSADGCCSRCGRGRGCRTSSCARRRCGRGRGRTSRPATG